MGMRKKLCLLTTVILSASIFSCGGGGGGGNGGNTLSIEEKLTASPVYKETTVGNTQVLLSPIATDVTEDKYAITYSKTGIIDPTEIQAGEKASNSTLDNSTIGEIASQINKPFTLSELNAKVIPKPIFSEDDAVAFLFDFSEGLPFDVTVSVNNYKVLTALPDNGFSLLENGTIPLPMYSADVAFYDNDGNRIWNINDKLKGMKISVVYPFDSANNTLSNVKTVTLYTFNGTGFDFLKKAKVSQSKPVPILDKAAPVILAYEDKQQQIKHFKGNLSLPYSIDLRGGIVVVDSSSNNVIGVGKIEDNSYNVYYIASNSTNPEFFLLSTILKGNGKIKIPAEVISSNKTIELSSEDFDSSFPMIDNLTEDDKAVLSKLFSWEDILGSVLSKDLLKEILHPSLSYGDKKVNSTIEAFFNGTSISEDLGNYTYKLFDGNCSLETYNVSDNKLKVGLLCNLGYGGTVKEQISIDKLREQIFSIGYNYSYSYSYQDGNYTENEMETDSRNYVLDIEDRAIRDFNGHKEWNLESSSGHSGYSYDYKFEYKGYNKYLGWIAGHEIHESHSPGFHLEYDGERIAKYKVENNESISTLSDVAKVTGLSFSSGFNLNLSIIGKTLMFTYDKGWHFNMSNSTLNLDPTLIFTYLQKLKTGQKSLD